MKTTVLALLISLAAVSIFVDTAYAQKRGEGQRKKLDPVGDVPALMEAEETRETLADLDGGKVTAATRPSEFKPMLIPVPRTGQDVKHRAGDDGDHRKGQPWPATRFIDNNDGTVADNLTGLVWLKNPSAFTVTTWSKALVACNKLSNGEAGLRDNSKPGDWRMPNVRELESLIDYSKQNPALPSGQPFQNVATGIYWTSTTVLDTPKTIYRGAIVNAAWVVDFSDGRVSDTEKTYETNLWPVRSSLPIAGQQAVTRPVPPPSSVVRTGQTRSWEAGDDGDLQKGRPWPEPRFTDNRNGTVTDQLTGLIWLKDRRTLGLASWGDALTRCNELADGMAGLTDGSKPGDWRLPNVREFQSLVDYSQQIPSLPRDHPFAKPSPASHWTSTIVGEKPFASYRMGLRSGSVGYSSHVGDDVVWPVRGGR